MKQGRPLRSGTKIGASPMTLSKELGRQVKWAYLTMVALGEMYYPRLKRVGTLATRFNLTTNQVHHLLYREGVE